MTKKLLILVALTLAPYLALAQSRPVGRGLAVTMGGIVLVQPAYPGADSYRVQPYPMVQVSLGNRGFLGPSPLGSGYGVGAYAVRTASVSLGGEFTMNDSRPASRADALAGMDDRDPTFGVGGFVSYRRGAIQGSLRVSQGLNDESGLTGTTRLSINGRVRRVMIGIGASLTLVDGKQMRRDFGITRREASRRVALIAAGDKRLRPGDAIAYNPSGGLRSVGASLAALVPFDEHWSFMGFSGVEWLSDRSAASPLVQRRFQLTTGLGLGYRL